MYTFVAQSLVRKIIEQRVPGSNPARAITGIFFSVSFNLLLISKDGCEKGRGTPRSWT